MANRKWRVTSLMLSALCVAACATPLPPSLTLNPQPNPRPPTVKPTDDTPQPPTPALAPTPFPREANAKIGREAWGAGEEVLREFKANGGVVSTVVAASSSKFVTRMSNTLTLDGKAHRRSLTTLDIPAQFIGTRVFEVSGYHAPLIGELPPKTYAVVLYFLNLTKQTILPLTFTVTYDGKLGAGGYQWLTSDTDFFDAIQRFNPPQAFEVPTLFRSQLGKTFWVSPAVWFDPQTADLFNTYYAQHSVFYKADGVRSAVCMSPTMQALSDETLKTKTWAEVAANFYADGALPPCVGLLSRY